MGVMKTNDGYHSVRHHRQSIDAEICLWTQLIHIYDKEKWNQNLAGPWRRSKSAPSKGRRTENIFIAFECRGK
jgi:hypothetical protein